MVAFDFFNGDVKITSSSDAGWSLGEGYSLVTVDHGEIRCEGRSIAVDSYVYLLISAKATSTTSSFSSRRLSALSSTRFVSS